MRCRIRTSSSEWRNVYSMKAQPSTKGNGLKVRMEDDLKEALAELARRNERSAGAEARVAIKLHIERHREGLRPPDLRA